jgi:PBP1b-binding outer membrane lipoprotein LpoB
MGRQVPAGMVFLNISPKITDMKKLHLLAVLAVSAMLVTACGNSSTTDETRTDSSTNVIPPPDNSSATNPSMADTAYSHSDSTKTMNSDSLKNKR